MDLESNTDRPLAVITGASSGIGYELAKQFALYGFDLILVSENPAVVETAQVCRNIGADVDVQIVNLSDEKIIKTFLEKIKKWKRPIEAIVINANINGGIYSENEMPIENELKLIYNNINALVYLAKYFLKEMVYRDKGRILFASSIEGVLPQALISTYESSLTFMNLYANSLITETQDSGVTVINLKPEDIYKHFTKKISGLDELIFNLGKESETIRLKH